MAKAIMIQGTMSSAGKSLICAGLCRIFMQDGYRVAPFKAQNMALNSYITHEGLEMGRAQAVQAQACGIEPSVRMNPILLKPVTDSGAQVILHGEVRGNMSAADYFAAKRTLVPEILRAYHSLEEEYDIIVLEGAGSPAEINLNAEDIVNMGMAKLAKAPVLLVGDIDRGGVFAQLYGTISLLSKEERDMVKATIINKFRGDVSLLLPGLEMLKGLTQKPVAGVIPYLPVDIEDEDSLAERLTKSTAGVALDIAVIRFPRLSNFTDFSALEATPGVGVRYVGSVDALGSPDMVILPGTKNTIEDLKWLRTSGLEAAVKKLASKGLVVLGLCGGYQMLGQHIVDEQGVEGGGEIAGMGLLPVRTTFSGEKRRGRTTARVLEIGGTLRGLSGVQLEGYEMHMGRTIMEAGAQPFLRLENGETEGCVQNNIYGSYLHGFFDAAACREAVLGALCAQKGVRLEAQAFDLETYREDQFNLLAKGLRESLNMDLIYRILQEGV